MKGVSGRFIGYVATGERTACHHQRETLGRFGRKMSWRLEWDPLGKTPPHAYGEESSHEHATVGHGALHPQDLPLTPHPLGHLAGEEGEPRDVAEEEGDAAVELVLLVGSQEAHGEEHGRICETASRVEEDHAGERHLRLHHVLHLPITLHAVNTDVNAML